MVLDFYLNNIKIKEPRNWQEIEFELSYEDDRPSAVLKTTTFEFDLENAATINAYIANGLNGGTGIFEGIPFKIIGCTSVVLFNGELVLTDPATNYECDVITCSVRESGRIDFLNDTANSFSFAYLASLPANAAGAITYSQYIDIPYVVSAIPDNSQIFSLSIMVFLMAKEVYELVRDLAELAADIAGVFTTVPGVIKFALEVAYVIIMVIALIKLIQALIDELIQPIKYKKGMRVKDLVQKACDYLGLSLSSTILNTAPYKDLVYIPRKTVAPSANLLKYRRTADEQNNSAAFGYYEGTFTDLLTDICKVFDGQVRVFNNTLYLEKYNNFNNQSTFKMPNVRIDPLNFTAPDPHGTNASEIFSNYLVEWMLDDSDMNTYNEFTGTNAQMIMQPIAVTNFKNRLLTGLNDVQLPFALGKRKETLTRVENFINNMLQNFINPLLNAINTLLNSNLSVNQITNRLGMLLLSNDFIGVPKLVILDQQNKISANNKLYTSAAYLLTQFHSGRFCLDNNQAPQTVPFDTGSITFTQKGNQYLTFKQKSIPLCCSDFTKLAGTNEIITEDNYIGKAELISWNPFKEEAKVNYRVKKKYTNNIKQTFIIDGKT